MIIDMTLATNKSEADLASSATVNAVLEALAERVVDLTLNAGFDGFPPEAYVIRVDPDGDVVVCELDDNNLPQTNATFAIPQAAIARIRVALGDDA